MTMFKGMRRSRRLAAITLMLLATSAAPPTQAFEKAIKGITFTLHCAGLMLSDPARHVAVCNPVRQPIDLSSTATMTTSPAAPIAAPPPPVVVVPPPPPPVIEEPPGCVIVQTNCGPICTYPDYAL